MRSAPELTRVAELSAEEPSGPPPASHRAVLTRLTAAMRDQARALVVAQAGFALGLGREDPPAAVQRAPFDEWIGEVVRMDTELAVTLAIDFERVIRAMNEGYAAGVSHELGVACAALSIRFSWELDILFPESAVGTQPVDDALLDDAVPDDADDDTAPSSEIVRSIPVPSGAECTNWSASIKDYLSLPSTPPQSEEAMDLLLEDLPFVMFEHPADLAQAAERLLGAPRSPA